MGTRLARAGLALAVVWGTATAYGADYDEALLGDLSDNPAAPTAWALESGANVLKGAAGTSSDYDILAVTIPAGYQLDSLYLDVFQISGYASFLGIQTGAEWTAGLGWSVDGTALIGWDLFDVGFVGTDRLPDVAQNGNTIEPQFAPPLGAGTYAVLLQDTATPFSYQFTFNVSPVPEPATWGLAALGLLGVARMSRRS